VRVIECDGMVKGSGLGTGLDPAEEIFVESLGEKEKSAPGCRVIGGGRPRKATRAGAGRNNAGIRGF